MRSRTKRGGGYKIVGEANDGATALALMERERPEVVLLDCRLPVFCGREVAALARERGYAARLIAYSAHEEYDDVMGMLRNGAVGYIVKNESPENLLEAIATVARGGTWFSQRIAKKLAEWAQATPAQTYGLTQAEETVLRLLAEGNSNREIATSLDIAERTARFHIGNISDKLHLARREQVLLWALENGYGKKRLREAQAPYSSEQE